MAGLVAEVADPILFASYQGTNAPPEIDARAARTFVPALLDLDDHGALQARVAAWSAFDDEQQALLQGFISAGLVRLDLTRDAVFVAHGSVFRPWSRLSGWLAPQQDRHEAQARLKQAADDWHRGGRRPEDLVHRAAVPTSRPNETLLSVERDYLRAIEAARGHQRRRWGLVSALVLAVVATFAFALWPDRTASPDNKALEASLRELKTAEFEGFELTAAQERALKPGDTFKECRTACPTMVVVPAGTFMMGDETGQQARLLPRHKVTIAQPFAVGVTELTIEQGLAFCERFGCGDDFTTTMKRADPNKALNHASWNNARQYVGMLSRLTGAQYRLLSSAEWEYMARAGSQTKYTWGDDIGKGRAHCRQCGVDFEKHTFEAEGRFPNWAAPVASFAPNAFGIYDVHGNLWEFVQDCWHETYEGAPRDGRPWMQADGGDCTKAVIRGGGGEGAPSGLRSAVRDWMRRDIARPEIGFRVARDLVLPPDLDGEGQAF